MSERATGYMPMVEPLPFQSSGAELLTRAIITQAQEEAEKIRVAARAAADALIATAEAEAVRRRQALAEEQQARALKEKDKALVLAALEARRLFLQSREELIERVFVRAEEALTAFRKQPSYPGLLRQLIQEGIAALTGNEFVVEVTPEDLPLAEQVLSSPAWHGKSAAVQATEGISGGCLVWRQDRRAYCDNSCVGILSRHKERLRPLIATWLFDDEKYWRG